MTLTCQQCGDSFEAKRAHATYCGTACRQRASRGSGAVIQPTSRPCEWCGEAFQAIRARFCAPRCREQAWLARPDVRDEQRARWRRNSKSNPAHKPTHARLAPGATPEQRFWAKVDTAGDCWPWQGCRDGSGYGQFWDGTRNVRTHRFAYELLRGAIPTGLTIDHLCRVTSCVNPDHLEPVTISENVRRGLAHR